MRKIKFKALSVANDKRNNIKVGDFVFGSFIQSGVDAPCIIFGDGEQIEIDVDTLCQLIGTDCGGNPLYSGDIVESDYYQPVLVERAAIFYCESEFKFKADSGEQDAYEYGNLTVIGNIHKNPELLSGK